MWINVRTFCGTKSERFDGLSKLTTIDILRQKIQEKFDVSSSEQKLFYRGKLLVDQHTLFDYNVQINDTIQLMIVKKAAEPESKVEIDTKPTEPVCEDCTGLYGIGEEVDVLDPGTCAWFEGVVRRCYQETRHTDTQLYYTVQLDGYEECDNMDVKPEEIRPRSFYVYPLSELKPELNCMVNYNLDSPSERGFWYDAQISSVAKKKGKYSVSAKIMLGSVPAEVELPFPDDVFRVESRQDSVVIDTVSNNIAKRKSAPQCSHCQDNKRKKCKYCACSVCGNKENPGQILLCDECDCAFHLYCLDPPLEAVPTEEDWYCSNCKNDASEIVQAGEGLKTKKKSRTPASNSNRDWGKGMACQGRSKICTIVPQDHVGPVPGIPVGSMWKYRLQVSEVGVHRPHVAGIHGRENDGAYSIVLSGGYEDDKDFGEEFKYTGSGGRDLSGNKRTAEQSCDQKLTKMNLALARCCAAPLDVKKGAEAEDWKKGRQIRVVRNCKLAKHSKYAPKEGNRYDGIYKLVKYWPEKGQSGFLVWRYLLRRDDPAPAPWTKEGEAMTKKLGIKLIFPEGYLDDKENKPDNKKKRKRNPGVPEVSSPNKKANNDVSAELQKLIKSDTANKKQWDDLLSDTSNWHDKVTEQFSCIICTDLVHEPVTTPCSHNMCLKCLNRSFKAEVFTCPNCRYDLGKTYSIKVNKNLQNVLLDIFPGYDCGR